MPPSKISRRSGPSNARANQYANAAAARHTAAPAAAPAGIVQAVQPPTQPQSDLIMSLPAELRDRIYDYFAVRHRKVTLDGSNTIIATGPLYLSGTSKRIRSEFGARIVKLHHARDYAVIVKDFDFSRLMRHLKQTDRLTRVKTIVIRLNITTPVIDVMKVLAWLKFIKGHAFKHSYEPWVLPAVSARRAFMTEVFRMEKDFVGKFKELFHITNSLREFWDGGKGEMNLAKPGEVPPMGDDWEKAAGDDVDSSGEEDGADDEDEEEDDEDGSGMDDDDESQGNEDEEMEDGDA